MSFKKQRVYIIPTRYGVMYAIGILVTLLCAAIYGNNLVYMLSFFLLALFLIGMVQTHNNMKGLTIDKLQMQMGVENGRSSGILWLRGSAHGEHVQLIIRMPEIDKNYQFIVDSVAAGTLTPCQFYFPTKSRGKHSVTQAKISSVFPFGMFFAWQTINTEAQYCIYPAPLGHSEFPLSFIRGDSQPAEKGLTGGYFSQHRSYQEGESQRRIDWKG